jgi:MinD-like ATPase involved in chromosome partitioning or flagellar assembly
MLIALFLEKAAAPRFYGVESQRVPDASQLAAAAARADVLIVDVEFDVKKVTANRCLVIDVSPEIRAFAESNGFDCVSVEGIIPWFNRAMGVDVSRKSRGTSVAAPVKTAKPAGEVQKDRYEAMFRVLVQELQKTDAYSGLDLESAQTFDVLLQAVRGSLKKADAAVGDMKTLEVSVREHQSRADGLQIKFDLMDEGVQAVMAGMSKAVAECVPILQKVTEVSADVDLLAYRAVGVKAHAAIGIAGKLTSAVKVKEHRAVATVVREFFDCVISILDEIVRVGADALRSSAGAVAATQSARLAQAEVERVVNGMRTELTHERDKTARLTAQVEEINAKYQEQLRITLEVESKLLLSGGESVPILREQIEELKNELSERDAMIASYKADESSTPVGGVSVDVLRGNVKHLRAQVAALRLERDNALTQAARYKTSAARELERAETLKRNAESLSHIVYQGGKVSALPLFKYSARGNILMVFGNGSAGITSAALSLAQLLGVNNRTVLVDFDIVTTDLENRFAEKINPINLNIEVNAPQGKRSAMGLFVEQGAAFFAANYNELVVRVDSNKSGVLDYLPGFYAKPDIFMLGQADYSTMLNYLGAHYEYIVIDAGKIGCSEIGDQIIRNLALCAFRRLIVTDAAVGKVRAMRLKMNDVFDADIRAIIENAVWVKNRALSREDLTRFTAPAKDITLPVIPEMVGRHESFHLSTAALREFRNVVNVLAGQ